MNQSIVNDLKLRLEHMENELRSDIESTSADVNCIAGDAESRGGLMLSQQVAIELKTRQEIRLLRVQNALKAIHAGTYGKCRKCGGRISVERLQIQPEAFLCIGCAA